MNPGSRVRALMVGERIIRSIGVHDAFSALLVEQAGFELVFLGGFGVSASLLGLPDLQFLGPGDMADTVGRLTSRLSIPLIADGDTGHGDLHQTMRTVEMFEAAGAAGILLEDQVMPKRCGHFAKKQVISIEEMVLKVRAAIKARKDPDFLIIARTDARQMGGLDDAIKRVNWYCETGADVAFVEAPQSVEELEEISLRVPYPLFANMLVGGATPILSADQLERMGYKFVVCPVETLLVCGQALRDLCRVFLEEGRVDRHLESVGAMTFEEIKALLGVDRYLGLREELDQS